MTIDLEDPDAWDDPEALLNALDGGGQPQDEATEQEDEGDAVAPERPKAGDHAAPDAQDDQPHDEAQEEGKGPGGDRLVPVKALAEVRGENAKLKERLEALEQQLQAGPAGRPEQPKPDQPAVDEDRAAIAQAMEQAKEDGDDVLERALKGQLASYDRLKALEERLATREQAAAADEATVRDAAFAASPVLVAWANDAERPAWHQNAVALHAELMRSDLEYQAKSWEQRFAQLPGLVEARMGVKSPHRTQQEQQPQRTQRSRPVKGAMPISSTDIPGSVARDPAPRTFDEIEQLPDQDAEAALIEAVETGGTEALYRFLDQAPIGALNSGSRRARR